MILPLLTKGAPERAPLLSGWRGVGAGAAPPAAPPLGSGCADRQMLAPAPARAGNRGTRSHPTGTCGTSLSVPAADKHLHLKSLF